MAINPKRTVEELQELRELTGDADGAQRVAWTDTWEAAREFLRQKVAETGATEEIDEAGNQWFTLRGASERALVIGGHLDSVPNGGWLDGCLNVLAGGAGLRPSSAGGGGPGQGRLPSSGHAEDGPARCGGGRGRCALRALALRLVGSGGLDARSDRAARTHRSGRDRV